MGQEVNLLKNYPQPKRNVSERGATKSEADREIARKFGREFFDGDRKTGYGGFSYNPKFWEPVIPDFKKYFNLSEKSSLLDVGCAKGFMVFDLMRLIPGINAQGIDISEYAINNSLESVKEFIQVANANDLPFDDNSFDVVISINTVHNLDIDGCAKSLQEIERVAKRGAFITVDAYRNEDEKERMFAWNLTGKTIMSTSEWVNFFDEVGYTGDYYWFIP
jgi:SAM-dependent methyltransferase